MNQTPLPPPVADARSGLRALAALLSQRSLLPALEITHAGVGDIFQITLPKFQPVVLVGPEYSRQVLVSHRNQYLWRTETDPVTALLRHGVLVEDGESHDRLREVMDPALHRRQINQHVYDMWQYTDEVVDKWGDGGIYDMLVEMRRIALLILMGTLFSVDFRPELERLWHPILRAIDYISPGLWIFWPNIPRPGYKRALDELDEYLYQIIRQRRLKAQTENDLIGSLIMSGASDDLIRDQLLTMLIAGHDTSTAQLTWTMYLLGRHPRAMAQAREEVDSVLGGQAPYTEALGQLKFLDQVIKETLRLYPPIHLGNRRTANDVFIQGYHLPAKTRVMYSIYLAHRHPKLWSEPARFCPERFDPSKRSGRFPPFAYLPFGGGPRNCIGAAFAQVEAKVVLARILQKVDLQLLSAKVRPHMGATLEPRPGVRMKVFHRG